MHEHPRLCASHQRQGEPRVLASLLLFFACSLRLNGDVEQRRANSQSIHPARVLHKEQYRAFALRTILDLKITMGQGIVTPLTIPALKYFA